MNKKYFVTTAFISSIDKGYWTDSIVKARLAQLWRKVWFGHGWFYNVRKNEDQIKKELQNLVV